MAEEMGERTEQPTGKRLSDARSKGKSARSADFSGALILLGATVSAMLFGAGLFEGLGHGMLHGLGAGTLATDLSGGRIRTDLVMVFAHAGRLVIPFVLIMMLVAGIAQVLQVGFMLSSKILSPDLSRLNPLMGFKRLFSMRSVVRAGLDVAKLGLLLVVAVLVIRSDLSR